MSVFTHKIRKLLSSTHTILINVKMLFFAMERGKRGQVAFEYLIIFGLSVALTLPLIVIFITQSQYLQADIAQAQIEKISFELETAAKEVYFLGEPSQKTVELRFPQGINTVTVGPNGINFNIQLVDNNYDIYTDFPMNVSGTLSDSQGLKVILVQARDGRVELSEQWNGDKSR